jgi:hypothetical protein
MWIKLSAEEKKQNRKKRILSSYLGLVFLSFIISILWKFGYTRYGSGYIGNSPFPIPESWGTVIIGEIIILLVLFFLYNISLNSKSQFKSNTFICNKCWKVKENNDMSIKCSCGGDFVYLDDYKYIDEKKIIKTE